MKKLTQKYRIIWNPETGEIIKAGEFDTNSTTVFNPDIYEGKEYSQKGWYENQLEEIENENKGDK